MLKWRIRKAIVPGAEVNFGGCITLDANWCSAGGLWVTESVRLDAADARGREIL